MNYESRLKKFANLAKKAMGRDEGGQLGSNIKMRMEASGHTLHGGFFTQAQSVWICGVEQKNEVDNDELLLEGAVRESLAKQKEANKDLCAVG